MTVVLLEHAEHILYAATAVVEDLFRRREPLPSMDVIYFIQPSKEKYGILINALLVTSYNNEFVYLD